MLKGKRVDDKTSSITYPIGILEPTLPHCSLSEYGIEASVLADNIWRDGLTKTGMVLRPARHDHTT